MFFQNIAQNWDKSGGAEGLLNNPLFQVGLSLLMDREGNPGKAVSQGLLGAQRSKDVSADRKAIKASRDRQEELNSKLQEIFAQQAGVPTQESLATIGAPQIAPELLQAAGAPQVDPSLLQGVQQQQGVMPQGQSMFPFGQAPGGANAPGADEITALMLQYGSPQQQMAAYTHLKAGDRFRQQLAAEESRYQKSQTLGNRLGQYNPRDYTTTSWTEFLKTEDPSVLERYETSKPINLGGGLTGSFSKATGEITRPVAKEEFTSNVRDVKSAAAQGTAQGKNLVVNKDELAAVNLQSSQLDRMLKDPAFEGAVGPFDKITTNFTESFGTKAGVLSKEVGRTAAALVRQAAATWKGAISEKELELFEESVPQRSDSAETWRHWYKNEFLPMKALAESKLGVTKTGTLPNGVNWSVE